MNYFLAHKMAQPVLPAEVIQKLNLIGAARAVASAARAGGGAARTWVRDATVRGGGFWRRTRAARAAVARAAVRARNRVGSRLDRMDRRSRDRQIARHTQGNERGVLWQRGGLRNGRIQRGRYLARRASGAALRENIAWGAFGAGYGLRSSL